MSATTEPPTKRVKTCAENKPSAQESSLSTVKSQVPSPSNQEPQATFSSSSSSAPSSSREGGTGEKPGDSPEERRKKALKELRSFTDMEPSFCGSDVVPSWDTKDVAATAAACVDAGMTADEVYRAIWRFDGEFVEEMAAAAVETLSRRGLSLSLSLMPCLQVAFPVIENVRNLLKHAQESSANSATLREAIDKVVTSLIEGPMSEMMGGMFPSYHPHPLHGDPARDDGTQNKRRAEFCHDGFIALFDAGGRPSAPVREAIPRGIRKWQGFYESPPATNCYETPWNRNAINRTIQVLWIMQHYPKAPPTPNPPIMERNAPSAGRSVGGGRKCVDCNTRLSPDAPHWKIRCINCWRLERRGVKRSAPQPAAAKKPSQSSTTPVAAGGQRKCLDCATAIPSNAPRWKVRCLDCWKKWKRRG